MSNLFGTTLGQLYKFKLLKDNIKGLEWQFTAVKPW